MGAQGGWAPKPWTSYSARTTFLRVPPVDWAGVKVGSKTEFRATGKHVTQLWNVQCPTPVVAWTLKPGDQYDKKLMVLEATWTEPLGAISPESIAREGFPDLAHFRRYWMARHHERFRPLTSVQVYRVRRWESFDLTAMGEALLKRLYQEHLP